MLGQVQISDAKPFEFTAELKHGIDKPLLLVTPKRFQKQRRRKIYLARMVGGGKRNDMTSKPINETASIKDRHPSLKPPRSE
jgi:hypothetical protein